MIAGAQHLNIIPLGKWRSTVGFMLLYVLGAIAALAIMETALLHRFQPTGAVFPNTNNLGAAMIPAIALALHLRRKAWAGLFVIILLLTLSRASIAALMVFALVYYSKGKKSRWILAAIPLLAGGIAIKSLMPNAGPVDQRLDLWRVALQMFQQNPIVGAGWFSFERTYQQLGASAAEMHGFHAHSLYLQIAAEHGLAGLSSLGIGGLAALRNMRKRSMRLGVALLIALGVHGAMDYVYWYIPNLLIVMLVLWVCRENNT